MADTSRETPPETQRPDSSERQAASSAKTKTLIVSIASFAILIAFALWTLLRTDFSTYSNDELNISEITKAPDSLQLLDDEPSDYGEENFIVVDNDESVSEAESEVSDVAETTPADNSLAIQELEWLLIAQQRELDALKTDFLTVERQLAQRDSEIAGLHLELEIARREAPVVAAEEATDEDRSAADLTQALTQENEQLRHTNSDLEVRLAETQLRLKETQDAVYQSESKSRDAEARSRELTRRQDELAKRVEVGMREKAQLEERVNQQQAKLIAQERSFQELSNAVKGHKQALKQMDQARMELASELDSTKGQYARLLQAVAAQHQEAPSYSSHSSTVVAAVTEPIRSSPATQEGQDVRYHVVGKGDTLTSISRHFYGTAQRWSEIYDANKTVLVDQNRLKVGLVLVIP